MAGTVVDDLEVVEVEDQQREALVVAPGALALAGKRVAETAAVEQARQRVADGQVCELLLLTAALRDVLDLGEDKRVISVLALQ